MESVAIRHAKKEDVAQAAELIIRTKRLNNEFDPMFTVSEDAPKKASSYVSVSISSPNTLLLVATRGGKIVGVLRAEMQQRLFYVPGNRGHITDFYVMPEFRRKALGNDMMDRAVAELKKMGADIVTAEVPSQNEIAVKFYNKRGFRPLQLIFAKQPQ